MKTPDIEPRRVQYEVKLYHPHEYGIRCLNAGQSVEVVLIVNPNDPRGIEPQIRTQVESGRYGFFRGDKCSQCGTLAHVSYWRKD